MLQILRVSKLWYSLPFKIDLPQDNEGSAFRLTVPAVSICTCNNMVGMGTARPITSIYVPAVRILTCTNMDKHSPSYSQRMTCVDHKIREAYKSVMAGDANTQCM